MLTLLLQLLTLQTSSQLHNYCTQTLQNTHAHRKRIRKKVKKKCDQIKLFKCRMWLKVIIHYFFSSNQPFHPLSLYFPHTFSFPNCLNPFLSLPFFLSPIIPYCVLCNLCICPIHPGSITSSAGRTLHAWLLISFTPAIWGWGFSGTAMRGAWTYPFVCTHIAFLPPTVNLCASVSEDRPDIGWWFLWWTWEQPG